MKRTVIKENKMGAKEVSFVEKSREVHGEWKDEIFIKPEGVECKHPDHEECWHKNLVVISGTELLAGLMKNEVSFTGGILYHAIGIGEAAWDTVLVQPSFSDRFLVSELYRQIPDDIYYLDALGDPTATITNRIEAKTTYDYDCPANGNFIREQGLSGGNATGAVDTGLFFDIIHHKSVYKDSSVKIVRYIRLTF